VAHFAALAPRHALAAIRAARLSEATWLELVPRLPIQARGFLRHRRDLGPAVEALLSQLGIDDFALAAPDLPPAEPAAMAQPEPEPDSAPASAEVIAFEQPAPLLSPAASEGIGAIVRRIEAFRRDRETRPAGQAPAGGATASPADPHPRLPFADEPPPTALHPESIDWRSTRSARWSLPMPIGHRCWWATARSPGSPMHRPGWMGAAFAPLPRAVRSPPACCCSKARRPSPVPGRSMPCRSSPAPVAPLPAIAPGCAAPPRRGKRPGAERSPGNAGRRSPAPDAA
jgi:hypothetical protein